MSLDEIAKIFALVVGSIVALLAICCLLILVVSLVLELINDIKKRSKEAERELKKKED